MTDNTLRQPQLTQCLQTDMKAWLNSGLLIVLTSRYTKEAVCIIHVCDKPTVGWVCMELESLKIMFNIMTNLTAEGYHTCECAETKVYPCDKGQPTYVYTENVNKVGFIGRMG